MNEELNKRLLDIPSVMMALINALNETGFKTTRVNPFHAWINREYLQGDPPGNAASNKIFVTNIATPQVSPFDITFIEINLDHDRFYLALTICFHSVMEGLLEAEEFNEIFRKHDELWMPQLVRLFQPAEMTFQLRWDTEYDETIEDTLFGYFPVPDVDRVLAAVRSINSCKEKGLCPVIIAGI